MSIIVLLSLIHFFLSFLLTIYKSKTTIFSVQKGNNDYLTFQETKVNINKQFQKIDINGISGWFEMCKSISE